jgi:hypothetical protein
MYLGIVERHDDQCCGMPLWSSTMRSFHILGVDILQKDVQNCFFAAIFAAPIISIVGRFFWP